MADDHRLMLAAVSAALERADDIEVVATTTDGANVVPLVAEHEPDIVVLDVLMPRIGGLDVLDRLRDRFPGLCVVLLSAADDPTLEAQARERGARALVSKGVDPNELPAILRRAATATQFERIGEDVRATPAADTAGMTKKEQLVLGAVARGLSNQQIARELWITEQTVKFHLSNIYRKLEVKNRTEAAQQALRRGLV